MTKSAASCTIDHLIDIVGKACNEQPICFGVVFLSSQMFVGCSCCSVIQNQRYQIRYKYGRSKQINTVALLDRGVRVQITTSDQQKDRRASALRTCPLRSDEYYYEEMVSASFLYLYSLCSVPTLLLPLLACSREKAHNFVGSRAVKSKL